MLHYVSVCSGIEAVSHAWEPLGMQPLAFAEIERFPSAILQHYYPQVPNLGDMTRIKKEDINGQAHILAGGTPCQSFSLAGDRGGMDDPRGQLALRFLDLAVELRVRWVVWENVAGVLSSNGGRDFAAFLQALGQRGYGWAYRVFDAQYFRVAQRRRRVILVGYFADWRPAAAVLFDRTGLSGAGAPSRTTQEAPAACLTGGPNVRGLTPDELNFVPEVTRTLLAGADGRSASPNDMTFVPQLAHAILSRTDSGPGSALDNATLIPLVAGTLGGGGTPAGWRCDTDRMTFIPEVATSLTGRMRGQDDGLANNVLAFGGNNCSGPIDVATACNAKAGYRIDFATETFLVQDTDLVWRVRRLTPIECERLMGFPDDYTLIPWWVGRAKNAKDAPDGLRYKALGNSMVTTLMAWVGRRLREVDGMKHVHE